MRVPLLAAGVVATVLAVAGCGASPPAGPAHPAPTSAARPARTTPAAVPAAGSTVITLRVEGTGTATLDVAGLPADVVVPRDVSLPWQLTTTLRQHSLIDLSATPDGNGSLTCQLTHDGSDTGVTGGVEGGVCTEMYGWFGNP